MSIAMVDLEKWMEEARNLCFLKSSNITAQAEATGYYNRHLAGIRNKVLEKMGVFDKGDFKNNFTTILHGVASLTEMGTGNCAELSFYVYVQALKHSTKSREKMAVVTFFRETSVDSHQCFVLGLPRDQDGRIKGFHPFNDETIFVDPWYNTIYTWKQIKVSQELISRYCDGVVSLNAYPEIVIAASKGKDSKELEETKLLEEICRQFAQHFEQHLSKDLIPTEANTEVQPTTRLRVFKSGQHTPACPTELMPSFGYVVDTKKAIGFIADQVLVELEKKDRNEVKMTRLIRLLKHLDPSNKLLSNPSFAYLYLFLARVPKIFNSDQPRCINLLVRAFEAAEALNREPRAFIHRNVCILISTLTIRNPELFKMVPSKVQVAMAAVKPKSSEPQTDGKVTGETLNTPSKGSSAVPAAPASAPSLALSPGSVLASARVQDGHQQTGLAFLPSVPLSPTISEAAGAAAAPKPCSRTK